MPEKRRPEGPALRGRVNHHDPDSTWEENARVQRRANDWYDGQLAAWEASELGQYVIGLERGLADCEAAGLAAGTACGEEKAALQSQLDALTGENADLTARVATLQALLTANGIPFPG